jgi:tropomodulin
MSRLTITGSTRDPKVDWNELDIDELVDRLTPGEIQSFLDECDPDDPHIPPSMRCNYKCEKGATGPLDKQKLLDFINDQALNTPDIPDRVPFVAGTVRGKKWVPPPKPKENNLGLGLDDSIELDIDMGEETEKALKEANTSDIIDLAGVLGLHSMMNQEQYHSAQSEKWSPRPDPTTGWSGVTKATPLKEFPPEEPNRTDPDDIINKIKSGDRSLKTANLNNIPISEERLLSMCEALKNNEVLEELSLANTSMGDFVAANLSAAIESNTKLLKLNIESNNVSPQCLVKIFEAANVQQVLQDIKASNQMAQFLGNKVEMAITKAVEGNKSLLKVGLHFEFGDCRNRVAVQLQKNLDRVRLRRIQQKLSTSGNSSGYEISSHPSGQMVATPKGREATPATEDEDDCSGTR